MIKYPDQPLMGGPNAPDPNTREKQYAVQFVKLLLEEQPAPEVAVEMFARALAAHRERAVQLERDPAAKAADLQLELAAALRAAAARKSDTPPAS